LTSRSSRSAPPWAISIRSRWTAGIRLRVGQRVPERPEHQRQRRAELVRDVREELGLGAVQRGALRRRSAPRPYSPPALDSAPATWRAISRKKSR
jgi:hypothetical protein